MAVDLKVSGDELLVEFHGIDKVLSFKGEMRIKLAHVKSVTFDPKAQKEHFVGLKLGGVNLPGWIRIGTYQNRDGLAFWDVRDAEKAVVIELHDESYARLIVQVDNPDQVVAEIEKAMKK
jgi:hypothetical protein